MQCQIQTQSLNGLWKYRVAKGAWQERDVPFSALAVGHSECEREFNLDGESECVKLTFLGITYEAHAYLNGFF